MAVVCVCVQVGEVNVMLIHCLLKHFKTDKKSFNKAEVEVHFFSGGQIRAN